MVEAPRHHGYILHGSITGLYKIGITGNVKNRLSTYRTHTPERIVQESVKDFLSHDEAKDWESYILGKHKASREHGEWLRLSFNEVSEICQEGLECCSVQNIRGDEIALISQVHEGEGSSLIRMFQFEAPWPGRSVADLWQYINDINLEDKIDLLRNAPRLIGRELMLRLIGEKAIATGMI